ncbi:hypothetical protein MCOR34_002095 [Pyricularia oryzae]|nr:hypothetical protein MCOR34_002095 [Pyricularia oryzae]KAI6580306.1 hypothetical protein MCOR04_005750 [Pyricularia oryzae]
MLPPFSPTVVLRHVLRIAVPLSVALTVYLYLYPIFSTCGFPLPPNADGKAPSAREIFWETVKLHYPVLGKSATQSNVSESSEEWVEEGSETPNVAVPRAPGRNAPFRLLALGDPQLEGDTSLPSHYMASLFPHIGKVWRDATFQTSHYSLRWRIRQIIHDFIDIFWIDFFNNIESIRKRIDLYGNDFYLAHIYRSVNWWTRPTHVSVLGDLLGSQWLTDEEFDRRADRYWNRVMRGAERVPDEEATYPADEYDLAGFLHSGDPRLPPNNGTNAVWARRVINIAGNHDVGYAGDINEDQMARFERRFGKANYELRFEIPTSALSPRAAATVFDAEENPHSDRLLPELRLVVLNSMNLDTPANSSELQDATYSFINNVINTASAVEYKGHFTVIMTHIPLHKPEGVCVDSPLFHFHDHDGSLREQNMLSVDASKGFLEGILGMSGDSMAPGNGRGRKGVILNGHDHAGCDTYHFINQSHGDGPADRSWEARRWREAALRRKAPEGAAAGEDQPLIGRPDYPGVREITVRSMMGDFGGNAGLLSAWFDEDAWEWCFEYATCPLGTQHLWWFVHILDLLVVVGILAYPVVTVAESMGVFATALEKSGGKVRGPATAGKAENNETAVKVEKPVVNAKAGPNGTLAQPSIAPL